MKWILTVLIVCIVGLQYRLWVGEGSVAEVVDLQGKIEQQKVEIDRLQDRNHLLALEVKDLQTGMSLIEERARSEMGMIKEDETFYMVVESADSNKLKPAKTDRVTAE